MMSRPACFFHFYVLARMLYSSLVDADYLDTEHFMTPDASQARNDQKRASIPELLEMLQAHPSYEVLDGFAGKPGAPGCAFRLRCSC